MTHPDSFGARSTLTVGDGAHEIFRLDALQSRYDVARLPFSLKVLLENLLRNEDGAGIRREDIEALATWDAKADPSKEIAFTPARVILQDFTGVPCVVDLAALRDAMAEMGGDPSAINLFAGWQWAGEGLFGASLLALLASLALALREIQISVAALNIELDSLQALEPPTA